MFPSAQRLAAACLALSACLQSEVREDNTVPLGLEHVAAAVATDEGVIRRLSGLWPGSNPPPVLREKGQIAWYFGWDTALREAGLDLQALSEGLLIPRPDCRPGLPPPIWTFEVSDDRGDGPISEERVPELSHPSLLATCPTEHLLRPAEEMPPGLAANISVENDCLADPCFGGIELLDGCQARINLDRCVGEEQAIFVDRLGQLCVDGNRECRNTAPENDAILSMVCTVGPEQCRFHLHQPEEALTISLERVRVASPLSEPSIAQRPNRIPYYAFHGGHVPDLAVGKTRIVALTRSSETTTRDCSDEGTPSTLTTVGGTPLQVLTRAEPGLPCLNVLTMDLEDQLYGVYGVYPELYFVRFDAAGAVESTRRIPSSTPLESAAFAPVDLLYEPESDRLVLALHTEQVQGSDRLVVATRDLREVHTSTLTELSISSIRRGKNPDGARRVVVTESTQSLAIWWQPLILAEESGAGLAAPSLRLGLLTSAPFGDGNVLGFFSEARPAFTRSRSGIPGAIAPPQWFFESAADATALAEFEWNEGKKRRLFIAARERGAGRLGRALLAEYGQGPQRRLRPGARVIGEGLVTGGQRDDAGNAWLALPWAGEVIRLDAPAPPP